MVEGLVRIRIRSASIAAGIAVDQVAIMFYDTNLHSPDAYQENMKLQLRQIRSMKAELGGKAPHYLFGVGTFKNMGVLRSYRDMRFENVHFTLRTLSSLLREISPSRSLVDGLAIYCEWEATAED